MTYKVINHKGEMKEKTLRNCDRCSNLADAKGKFNKEVPNAGGANFWRRLCEWLMEVSK